MSQVRRTELILDGMVGVSLLAVLLTSDLSTRGVSSVLGAYAFAGLLYRCIGYARSMDALHWALAVLLASTILIAAIGTYRLDRLNAPPSGVVWWVMAHRVLTLALIVVWPWLIGRVRLTGSGDSRRRGDPHRGL